MKLFTLLSLIVVAEFKCLSDHKFIEIIPQTRDQIQFLRNLEGRCETSQSFSFMKYPTEINETIQMVVAPENINLFNNMMRSKSLKVKILAGNIQQKLDSEKLDICQGAMNWHCYQPYEKICDWIKSLPEKYPDQVTVINYGRTFEERDIIGVKLSLNDKVKKAVFLEGGLLGNSFISPATVTYILNEFLTSKNQSIQFLAERYDWYMFPSVNPDSYVYARSLCTRRFWLKTRSYDLYSYFCPGVNPDMNFKYMWKELGYSDYKCSNFYSGTEPFSEIETNNLARFLQTIAEDLFAYISFQSYGQNLMVPYAHTSDRLDNYAQMVLIAQRAALALEHRYGTKYRVGTIHEVTGGSSGTSTGWVKACLELPVVVTYKLRPFEQIVLECENIIPNGEEVIDSLIVLFREASKYGYGNIINTTLRDRRNFKNLGPN